VSAGNYQKVTTRSGLGVLVMSNSAVQSGIRRLRERLAAQGRQNESDEQLLHIFLSRRDDIAFAALVRRHGPMVMGVCRRMLGHQQDAEDAFQATFLVLSRNAASLRKKSSLASWLHGTAHRIAMKAKQSAARRRKHEGQTPARPAADPVGELLWREVRTLLDEEIACLPKTQQSVFVLCCLENLSQTEAARRLGLKERTASNRLAEARKRLQLRLSRRGVELTALLAAAALTTETASAPPVALLTKVIEGMASPAVAALASSGPSILSVGTIKLAAALVVMVSVLTGAGLWAYRSPATTSDFPPQPAAKERADDRPKPRTPRQEKRQTVEVNGQVLDPDGKPVRGAKLLFLWWGEELPNKVWAMSGAEGRFRFAVRRPPVANSGWEMPGEPPYVMAAAEGYGFAVAQLDKFETAANLTLRVIKDDVPIRGRILNLEGKPVASVRVSISDCQPLNMPPLFVPKKGDLTDWLAALKANKKDPWRAERAYLIGLYSHAFDLLFPSVTTGADGRFELRGIGRERLAHLRIEGPTIATQVVNVITRPGEKIRLPLSRRSPKGETITYYGAAFEVLAEPTKPVVGVVRDKETGKPLAGVTIAPNKITNSWNISNHNAWLIHTTTDKDGRYRLVGLPKGEDNQLMATTKNLPYLPVSQKVENTPGLEPVTVDFALKRGVWVKGRVTEKTTGKPLAASVIYFCFRENPHAKEIPLLFGGGLGGSTREDGSFQFVAVPNRGLIAVQAHHNGRYLSGVGVEKIKVPRDRMGDVKYLETYPFLCYFESYNTLAEIAPKSGDESITCDLVVIPDPGLTRTGTVLGPDGKPLADIQATGARVNGAGFTVDRLKPNERRLIQFVHEDKKLAGYLVVRGDEKGPLQVRLEPWGALTGRIITTKGEPLTGVRWIRCKMSEIRDGSVVYNFDLTSPLSEDGRFRIEELAPGLKYELVVSKLGYAVEVVEGRSKDLTVKAGETKDVGVLKVKVKE
jgi:RNA polymerase sigma factor (sigma-70 family)